MNNTFRPPIGLNFWKDGRLSFCVWSPGKKKVEVVFLSTQTDLFELDHFDEDGYFWAYFSKEYIGCQYAYYLDGEGPYADPASRYLPEGVKGMASVGDFSFKWSDVGYQGQAWEKLVFYEIHVGTFSREGNFEGIIPFLEHFQEIGITAIQLMPIAQFSGRRNWGYDGVFPFSVQNTYGGPIGLKKLVDACHGWNIALFLDCVYNHLGPEGNIFSKFAPYFHTEKNTPWGPAIAFEQEYGKEISHFFLQNALMWLREFHVDGIRLDCIDEIYDFQTEPFLSELVNQVELISKNSFQRHLIGETDQNSPHFLSKDGGPGLSGVWHNELHRSIHGALSEDKMGWYQDFNGIEPIKKTLLNGYYFTGEYSEYLKRNFGQSFPKEKQSFLVAYNQNHDLVGNRPDGSRISLQYGTLKRKLAQFLLLYSPYIPLIFMGEEWGSTSPFYFFADHHDEDLREGVRQGRRNAFERQNFEGPYNDPYDLETFKASILNHSQKEDPYFNENLQFFKELLKTREMTLPVGIKVKNFEIPTSNKNFLSYALSCKKWSLCLLANISEADEKGSVKIPGQSLDWEKGIDLYEMSPFRNKSHIPQSVTSGETQFHLGPFQGIMYRSMSNR